MIVGRIILGSAFALIPAWVLTGGEYPLLGAAGFAAMMLGIALS